MMNSNQEFDLELYRPKVDKESDKYSWLLYQWVKRHRNMLPERPAVMFSGRWLLREETEFTPDRVPAGTLIIGQLTEDRWAIGARLSSIMHRNGEMFAHPERDWQNVGDWFWPRYLDVGRCIFDPNHTTYFEGEAGRFTKLNDQHRKCNWCGEEQLLHHREIKKIRTIWQTVESGR